jgi:hypothetical protein
VFCIRYYCLLILGLNLGTSSFYSHCLFQNMRILVYRRLYLRCRLCCLLPMNRVVRFLLLYQPSRLGYQFIRRLLLSFNIMVGSSICQDLNNQNNHLSFTVWYLLVEKLLSSLTLVVFFSAKVILGLVAQFVKT